MIADIEELEKVDASEIHARRLNAKEVLTPQSSVNFIFPVADGTVRIFGRGQRLRTSALTRDRGQGDGVTKAGGQQAAGAPARVPNPACVQTPEVGGGTCRERRAN